MSRNRSLTPEDLYKIFRNHSDVYILNSGTGRVVVTKRGARVIGMFTSKSSENVLWVYPGIERSLETGHWMVGGERLWLAPERDFFYKFPERFDGFFVSEGIDPGNYTHRGGLEFENRFFLKNNSAKKKFSNATLKRGFNTLEDPYSTGMAYTGIRIHDSAITSDSDIDLCCWSVTQLRPGRPKRPATVLFPCTEEACLIPYFSEIPDEYGEVNGDYARFRVDSKKILKTALAPEHLRDETMCRIIYILPVSGDRYQCVMKRSKNIPDSQDECLDIPKNPDAGSRGSVQAYNCGPGFSDEDEFLFGEIELQSKGIGVRGTRISELSHELLVYTGTRNEILELTSRALKLSSPPLMY